MPKHVFNMSLKRCLVSLKFLLILLLSRSYGNVIYDLTRKYDGLLSLQDLRKFEKLTIKKRKSDLEVSFLRSCRKFNVFTKFVCFSLPNIDRYDTHYIRKRLLRSATLKRSKENNKPTSDLSILETKLKATLSSLDWTILTRHLKKNVDKQMKKIILTHQKKLRNLTKNTALPFTCTRKRLRIFPRTDNVTDNELDILKNGLGFSIKPLQLYEAEILATFEMIHQEIKKNLRNREHSKILKVKLAISPTVTSQHIIQQCRI